jgi:hypothetical protein
MRRASLCLVCGIFALGVAACGTVLGTFDVSDDGGPGVTNGEGGVSTGEGGVNGADGSGVDGSGGTDGSLTTLDGGAVEAGPRACTISAGVSMGCNNNKEYCESSDCMTGICKLMPPELNTMPNPRCGCNGITYWNEEVAARHGQSVMNGTDGCSPSKACTGQCNPGGPGKYGCAITISGAVCSSGAASAGQCWGLPDTCPSSPTVLSCDGGSCASKCDTFESNLPYRTTGTLICK